MAYRGKMQHYLMQGRREMILERDFVRVLEGAQSATWLAIGWSLLCSENDAAAFLLREDETALTIVVENSY